MTILAGSRPEGLAHGTVLVLLLSLHMRKIGHHPDAHGRHRLWRALDQLHLIPPPLFNNAHGAFAARGVHGQTIYIDPTADMVIVRFASYPIAFNSRIDPTSLPAYQAVAEYLMAQD